MKKITLITFLILSVIYINNSQAQDASSDSTKVDPLFNFYAGIYNISNQFEDREIARMALYHLLLMSPNKSAILDSLSLSYYDDQKWVPTILTSTENLKLNPDNELAMELSAISYQNLGIQEKALEQYESLFLKNNQTLTLYKVAFLQYELSRYQEASASAEILLKRTDIADQKLYFPKVDKSQQEVSMKSALLNLKGLIAIANGNITEAKEFYLEALKETPGFEVAQKNLAAAK